MSLQRRHALMLLGGLAAAPVVFVLAAWLVLQTSAAHRELASLLASTLASENGTAEVKGLSGRLPFTLRLERFALGDEQGWWLEIDDLSLDWNPLALLRSRVRVASLAAARIRLDRLPPSAPEEAPPVEAGPLWPPPPLSLPEIFLDSLEVDRFELGQAVLGQAAVFRVSGSATGRGEAVQARLDVPRIDGHDSALRLTAQADLSAWTLALDARLHEAPGGLVAGLASLPAHLPLAGSLTGQGALQDWRGILEARADNATLLEGSVHLAVPPHKEQDARIAVDLTVHPQPELLPADAPSQARAALQTLGPAVRLTADLQCSSDLANLEIVSMALDAGPVVLRSQGALTEQSLALDATVAAADLAPLGLLAGEALAGEFQAVIQLRGTPRAPLLSVDATLGQARLPGVAAAALTIQARAEPLAPLDQPFAGVKTQGVSNATGLVLDGAPVALGPAVQAQWNIEADPHGGMRVAELSVRDGDTVISVSGPINLSGILDLQLAASGLDLRQRLPGVPLTGTASVQATASGNLARQQVALNATVGVEGLASRAPDLEPAMRLLGASPSLVLAAQLHNRTVVLESLRLAGTALGLDAEGSVDLASESLDARTRVRLATLAPLEGWIGQPIAGVCELDLNATGPLASPVATLQLDARHIASPGMALKRVRLSGDLRGEAAGDTAAPSPQALLGAMALDLSGDQGDFALRTRYRFQEPFLRLDGLELRGPGTSLAGALEVDLQRSLASGALKGGAQDLVPLGRTLGQQLAGTVQLAAEFIVADGRQHMELTVDAARVQAGDAALGRLKLAASLRNVLQAPQGSVSLQATTLTAGGARVGSASVTARGDGGKIAFTVVAKDGEVGGAPFAADLAGDVALPQGGVDLTLSRLSAAYAGTPAKLLAPLRVSQRGPSLEVKGLSLQYGPARLTASVVKSPETLAGEAAVSALSLSRLQEFGVSGVENMQGEVRLQLGLSGTPANPRATVQLKTTGLRATGDAVLAEMPALTLDAEAGLTREALKATVRLSGLSGKAGQGESGGEPVTITASLPATFVLEPFQFRLGDGPLAASAKGDVDLARFSTMLEHFDARCRGRLVLDMDVSGSLDAPQVRGGITLEKGFLEALSTGTVLDPVTMNIQASNTVIALTALDVRDRAGGRLLASGSLQLEDGFPFQVKVAINNFTPARHTLGTGKLSGEVAVLGTAKGGKATGVLTIAPASISLPTRLPPDVAPVDKLEIVFGNATTAQDGAPRTPAAPGWPLELDVQVRIPNSLRIHGLGLDSTWGGNLRVQGMAARPSLVGAVAVSRGDVNFLGKRFVISKGEVGFGGDWPPDPLVVVEATTDAGDVTAILQLQGHADDLDLTLGSNPVLPREEVLSRILFGRDLQNLSALQAVQLAKAGSMLLGSSGVWDMLGRSDELLPGLSFGGSGDGEPSAVGRFLDRARNSMRVDVRQPVGKTSNEIAVEVDITNDIMLHGTVDDRGQEGVGLQWKHDY